MGDCQTLQIWLRNLIKYGGMLNIRFVWHRTSNVCRIFGGWKLAERIFENSNEDQKMQILFFARKEFFVQKRIFVKGGCQTERFLEASNSNAEEKNICEWWMK